MQTIYLARLKVPLLGYIHVAASSHGVLRVSLADDGDALRAELQREHPAAEIKHGGGMTVEAAREIRRYLAGGPTPDLPVVFTRDGFAAQVWKRIAKIPKGEVRSYARIAKDLRKPGASRAVGQACGRNPVPLVVPCHRVVTSDRGLGGFTGGLDIKRKLLALEGVTLKG